MTDDNAIARPSPNRQPNSVEDFRKFLTVKESTLAQYATNGVKPEALIRFCLLEYSQSERLQACTRQSLYLALIACAVTGLEPGSLRGHAYIVPYGKDATFVPGYKGLIMLARRSRAVTKIAMQVVYDGDEFDYDVGSSAFVKHKPTLGVRGDIIAAYAAATLGGTDVELEVMPREELDKIKRASKGGPAWKDWESEMFRKAPLRRLAKRLPLGSDYFVAAQLDTEVDQQNMAGYRQVIDVATDGEASRSDESERASERAEAVRDKLTTRGG